MKKPFAAAFNPMNTYVVVAWCMYPASKRNNDAFGQKFKEVNSTQKTIFI